MKKQGRRIPCVVRKEMGGGFLIVFPTIPGSTAGRSVSSPALCYSTFDGHSSIEFGYFIKHTQKLLKEQQQNILNEYLKLVSEHITADDEYVLANDWTSEHDEKRNTELWRHVMHGALNRYKETNNQKGEQS